jgi:hypothetical protein
MVPVVIIASELNNPFSDDFNVLADGVVVGRIMKVHAAFPKGIGVNLASATPLCRS